MYDQVQELGKILRNSRPTYTEEGKPISPVNHLSEAAQEALESEIATIMKRTSKYLDQCGMRAKKPLWVYDKSNPETHISSLEFKFGHLIAL